MNLALIQELKQRTMSFEIPTSAPRHLKKQFNKIALIDADRYKHVVVYRVFQELQTGKEHTETLVESVIEDYLYNDIFSVFEAKAYIFCFSASSKDVFRNAVAQEKKYKGGRGKGVDSYDYPEKWSDMAHVFTYINNIYPTLVFDDLEADDLLSMLQHPTDTFIFSHDKDLKQVIGFHYQMDMGLLMYTDEREGFERLIHQILLGDTTDSIPGLKGFGPSALEKFKKLMEGAEGLELLVGSIKQYTDKYGVLHGMDTFAEMWHLVSMRLNRGEHCQEKYHSAFKLVETMIDESIHRAVVSD